MKIGDTAPDFEAETTEGRIRFHDWIGDSWAVLFSHPKDFTPVCTTELGYMAKIKPHFDRRNVKIIGLSVDSTGDHQGWAKDIAEAQCLTRRRRSVIHKAGRRRSRISGSFRSHNNWHRPSRAISLTARTGFGRARPPGAPTDGSASRPYQLQRGRRLLGRIFHRVLIKIPLQFCI